MVIVQALLAALTRSAGKLLNTAFAWATVLLFGRVSEQRQIYVSAIAFGAVIWLVVLVGVALPSVGTFLLSFVPLPDWVDKKWVRLAMLVAVAIIPAIVGVVSILMLEKPRRPQSIAAKAVAVLKGYPYTIGLAMTLTMMTVFAPVMKIRTLAKRWTSEHVPMIVKPEDYEDVVAAVHNSLEAGGLDTVRERASWMLRMPTKILTLFARSAVSNLVAGDMAMLRSDTIEGVLHPSDLVISGPKGTAARARAIIAERLVFTPAYLTWDKEANEIEDRLRTIWDAQRTRPSGDLRRALSRVESDLHRLEIAYDEWEVLFREFLLVQHAVLDSRDVAAGSVAPTLAAGIVVAAPHLARAAEALEHSLDHIRKGAKDTPKRTWLSVVAALLTSITAHAGTKRRGPQISSRDRDRRQAA